MKFSNAAIKHPTTVFILTLMLMVFGIYAYIELPLEAAPDVELPFILVTTDYRGVTPEDMENMVTMPLEKRLRGIKDVKKITSKSAEGNSLITVEFHSGTNIDDALQRVRDKVEQAKPDLPDEADVPSVKEINFSEMPIMNISLTPLSGKQAEVVDPLRLKQMAEDIADEIEVIGGVLEANVVGGVTREIRIEMDPDRIAAYRIPISELMELITRENVNVSGGSVEMAKGKYQLRVSGEFTNPMQIYHLIIMTHNGKPIYVTDVAKVIDGFEDRRNYSRLNGQDSVSIVVSKRSGENVPKITEKIKAFMENESQYILGNRAKYAITMDISKDIRMMVEDLESNVISGLVLVVLVLMVAMGLRNSFFVGLAIPFSMLITFAVLYVLKITLNMVVLFSLTLALGMLVDNAIVIVENIYRHIQEGQPRLQAAMTATAEVAWPIISSTATTVGAFIPLLFWPDIMGEFMSYLPKTVIIALLASLFVAMIINPTLCGAVMRKPKALSRKRKPHYLVNAYTAVLHFALAHPVVVVATTVVVFVGSAYALVLFGTGVELFPEVEPRRCFIDVTLGEGTRLDATDAVVREIARRIEHIPDKKHVVETTGSKSGTNPLEGGESGSNVGQIAVEFVDRDDRRQDSRVTIKQIREATSGIPGVRIEVLKEKEGPPTGAPITIEVSGEDFDVLAKLTRDIKDRIKSVPGLVDLRDNYEEAKPEIQFPVDRNRAKLMGVSTAWVAQFIKVCVNGIKLGTYREGEEEYDIVLRLADRYRYDLDRIRSLYVPDMYGRQIPLSSLTQIAYEGGYGVIRRIDQKRVITIVGENAEGIKADKVLTHVQDRLKDFRLPSGYRITFTGESEEQQKAADFLLKAGITALFLIALTLVTQFDSIRLPIIIMIAVLLSFIGVAWSLIITGRPFSVIMTGVGVISLAGVVVNNGIVLVAYIEQLRKKGLPPYAAIIKAGQTRMRPVLLTAITTMLGLAPMAIGLSFNIHKLDFDFESEMSQYWGPMAITVIYGLAVATVLTLLVVPAIYALFLKLAISYEPLHGEVSVAGAVVADDAVTASHDTPTETDVGTS